MSLPCRRMSIKVQMYWFALFSDRSEDSRIADDYLRQAMVFLFKQIVKTNSI